MTNDKNNNEKFTVGFIDVTDQALTDVLDAFQRKATEGGIDLRRSVARTFGNAVTVEYTAVGYKARLPQADTLHAMMKDAAAGLATDLDVETHSTPNGPVFNVTRPLAIA